VTDGVTATKAAAAELTDKDRATSLDLARANMVRARESIQSAIGLLQYGGWPETSQDLTRMRAMADTWLEPGGMFDHLARGLPPPSEGGAA
jgi:hypothetical protein